jgi:hypothetical protein
VDDGFQLVAGIGMLEHQGAHGRPVQTAVGFDHLAAKAFADQRHGRAASGGQTAGDGIGIQQGRAPCRQHLAHGAFAAADTACQTQAQRVSVHHIPAKANRLRSIVSEPNTMAAKPAPAKKGPKGM